MEIFSSEKLKNISIIIMNHSEPSQKDRKPRTSNGVKICFFLHRRFAFIGHDLAVHLKNRHGIDRFCAYVMHRPSMRFLQSQKEIEYSSLLLDEDLHNQAKGKKLDLEYIKFLEKEYGIPNLWPYIEVDRVVRHNQFVREYPMDETKYTHEEMMVLLQVRAKAIIEMLEREKPDYLFASVVGGMGALLLFHIAKKKGVKVRMIMPVRTGTRYAISGTYDSLTEIDEEFDQLMKGGGRVENYSEAKRYLEEFRDNPETYAKSIKHYLKRAGYLKQLDFLLPSKLKTYIIWLFGRIEYFISEQDRHDFTYIRTIPKIKDQITRKLRAFRGVSDLYDDIDPDNEDFAFFPLHLEPETSLLLYAYRYTNQIEVLRQVAKSLPIHFKLYVKDHPKMIGFRTREYYKTLKKIPNVKLLDPRINSLEFLGKAKLVTVITGSVGWEALQLKVPVITFGDVFFNKLSMVERCYSYDKLSEIVKHQLENFSYNEEEIVNYIGLILKHSVKVDLYHLWFKEPDVKKKREKLTGLADLIAGNLT